MSLCDYSHCYPHRGVYNLAFAHCNYIRNAHTHILKEMTTVAPQPVPPVEKLPPPPALDLIDASAIGTDYTVDAKLGEGTYGVVFRAQNRHTGAYVAIKKLRLEGLSEGVPATAIREITLLQDLANHPNIVQLLQVISRRGRLYLVFELMKDDLRLFIYSFVRFNHKAHAGKPPFPAMTVTMVRDLTRQLLHALWTCHEHRIIHRDLKPGNILISQLPPTKGETTPQYRLKVADFGLARTFDLPLCTYTHEVVTLWYRAPEILLGEKHYTPAVDVWSVGLIALEMLTGNPLLRGDSNSDQLAKMFAIMGVPTEESWPGLNQFLTKTNVSLSALASRVSGTVKNCEPCGRLKGWCRPHLQRILLAASSTSGTDPSDVALARAEEGIDFFEWMLTMDPRQRPTVSDALTHRWLQ